MVREESLKLGLLERNIEDMISRTPPYLLNQQNRKHPNMSDSTPIGQTLGGSWMDPTNASSGNYNQFDLLPTSNGDSSSPLQSQTIYTGVVPQDGVTKAYLPELCSITSKTSATSGSPYKEGTPRVANLDPSEHIRLLLGGRKSGGSNSRTLDYQLPHQLSSFYHVVSQTNNGSKDWNPSQQKQLAQYHCSQPTRNEQLSLPSYWSSHHTSNSDIVVHSSRTRATSASVLGKCPTVSNPAHSFFQPPQPSVLGKRPTTNKPSQSFFQPSPPPVLGKRPTASNPVWSFFGPLPLMPYNADDMGPQCRLETLEMLSLVQSMGTPEFLATSDKVLRSGSSLHDPLHATTAQIPVHGGSGTSAASAPLLLGLGNGGAISKGKGKELRSYWDLDDMVEMMESMNKRHKKVMDQTFLDLTLGSDGQGRN